jgi:hypothetical protein
MVKLAAQLRSKRTAKRLRLLAAAHVKRAAVTCENGLLGGIMGWELAALLDMDVRRADYEKRLHY